jgi:N-acetylglucosaminyl-diphospho-decaprenol L-rhamnosyltransferase
MWSPGRGPRSLLRVPATIAVLTMTRARHELLLGQVDGLSVGSVPPHVHSVVSMGDRDLTRGRLPLGTDRWTTVVKPVQTDRRALPLAAARNLAARNAIDLGADVLIFLDGDVIPGERTLERYAEAVTSGASRTAGVTHPVLWCGPVLDLPLADRPEVGYPMRQLHDLGRRTPGTPPLAVGQYQVEERWMLFSGSSFAMSRQDFEASGGFCPDYAGPGLQDRDFAEVVRSRGGSMVWVGGATGYRQPAPAGEEVDHVRHACAHAQVWQQRWGSQADHPWLARLAAQGLLRRDDQGVLVPA